MYNRSSVSRICRVSAKTQAHLSCKRIFEEILRTTGCALAVRRQKNWLLA
jgi:hypothetical protein